ncbi:hypothetical protein D3C75_1061520 [compost metagenome]
MAKGKPECAAQILLDAAKIRIQPVPDFLIIQIALHRCDNLRNLLRSGSMAKEREHLACQRHTDIVAGFFFYTFPVIIVITVEPAVS